MSLTHAMERSGGRGKTKEEKRVSITCSKLVEFKGKYEKGR